MSKQRNKPVEDSNPTEKGAERKIIITFGGAQLPGTKCKVTFGDNSLKSFSNYPLPRQGRIYSCLTLEGWKDILAHILIVIFAIIFTGVIVIVLFLLGLTVGDVAIIISILSMVLGILRATLHH